MKKLNVLSLFDGMSCGQIALDQLGIEVERYYASEIETDAIKVTQHNYPKTIQMGTITNWRDWDIDWSSIDLIFGGSPCQGFSRAGKGLNFQDSRSKLFFDFLDILKHIKKVNPDVKFLLENVRMKQEWIDVISEYMEVKPININSKLLSPALRNRFYWTNIAKIEQPEDTRVTLQSILEKGVTDREKSRALLESDSRPLATPSRMWHGYKSTGFTTLIFKDKELLLRVKEATKKGYVDIRDMEGVDLSFPTSKTRRGRHMKEKSNCLTKTPNEYYIFEKGDLRYMTQTELERCQTVPDGYTKIVSRNKAASLLGNGWTVEVIKHIFKKLL